MKYYSVYSVKIDQSSVLITNNCHLSRACRVWCVIVVCSKIEVQGFPTLFFLPGKGKNTPIQYDGARETEAMASFIMEKVSGLPCERRE